MMLDAYADKAVILKLPDAQEVSGVGAGVDASGALVLRDSRGGLRTFSGGEISLRLDLHPR
jgi:biotin-(acetyl-CoA carboxylase) ligase